MKSQTVSFATQTKDGTVTRIGKSTVLQPKTNFKGGSIRWTNDKLSKADGK